MEPKYDFYFKNEQRRFASLTLHEFAVLKCQSGYTLPVKKPKAYGLYIVVDGKGVYTLKGGKFPAGAGDCFVLYPNTEIKCQADKKEPWTLIMINFDGSDAKFLLEVSDFSQKAPLRHLREQITKEVLQVLTGFYRFRGDDIYHAIVSTGMLYLTMSILVNSTRYFTPEDESATADSPVPHSFASAAHFNKALDFITKNYSRNITVDDIAKHVNLSRSRLYRIFLAQVSISPHQYLTGFRIREAAVLLEKRKDTIKEIAQAVGIDNPLYFSTLFKQIMGKSPTEFIKDAPG
jgi:AraC-like DNA-binding protein